MRRLVILFILHFFISICYAQMESPAEEKRKKDSLVTLLKKIPEHSSKTNDTIRLNTIFALIKRFEGDTAMYYLNYSLRQCKAYSPFVANTETKSVAELQEALKNDNYLNYYLKLNIKLLLYMGGSQNNDEDKLKLFLKALKISEKTGYKIGEASAHLSICYVYNKQSVFNKAIENLLVAQTIYRQINNKNLLASSYRYLAEIYQKQDRNDLALQNLIIALKIAKESNDVFSIGVYYERIGNCYINLGNYPKAIENHFASLKISEQLNDIKGVGDSYSDIAAIYYTMKDYQKSRVNWLSALNKYKEFGKPYLIANGYKDVAEANYRLSEFDEGLLNLDSALVIYIKEKEYYDEALIYSLIADIYIEKHDFVKTVSYLNKAVELSKKHNFFENLMKSYKSLADIYVKSNDYKAAYMYHLQFIDMKDSLAKYKDETVENITEMQSKFDKDKTEQEKLLHEAVVAQKEAKLEQEKTQRYALYGGLFLVIAFSVFVFNRFRVTQKQKHIIEQQKHMVDEAFKTLAEKNKEVMDSITYAQRIQKALITSELYIEKQLNRLSKTDNK